MQSEQNETQLCDVVILTALPVEYKAVRRHLKQLKEVRHPQGTIYECGIFVGQYRIWRVAVVEIGMGGIGAASETERALQFFQASLALFSGIAGGIKDVRRGDVVVADKVYSYEPGKELANEHLSRPEIGSGSYDLVQRARADARNEKWLDRLPAPAPESPPQVWIGALAAGEKVVASTKSRIYRLLQKNFGDTLAVEMEGHGFLDALHANQAVHGLVIRGISDLIDDKAEAEKADSQRLAAEHAAAFAFELLFHYKLPLDRVSTTPTMTIPGNQKRPQRQHAEKQANWNTHIEIFTSYADKDEKSLLTLLNALEISLRSLKQKGKVSLWSKRDLLPGAKKEEEIHEHLQSARVFLLLISADYMNLDFCYSKDMDRLMQRHHSGEARVIPILLRDAFWQEAPFGGLTPLPDSGEFVNNIDNKDRVFLNIASGVRKFIDSMLAPESE